MSVDHIGQYFKDAPLWRTQERRDNAWQQCMSETILASAGESAPIFPDLVEESLAQIVRQVERKLAVVFAQPKHTCGAACKLQSSTKLSNRFFFLLLLCCFLA